MKKISFIAILALILVSTMIFVGCQDPKPTTNETTTTTTSNPPETVRYTVTEAEWNAWTTYKNYTITQHYGDEELLIHKYTEGALQFTDGAIILFIDDKQYSLDETDEGYIAHDVTSVEFSHDGLLGGGYVYDEFTYDEELGAYVLDLIAEEGMIWEVRFEDGVPVSVIYKEIENGEAVFTITSYYTNVGTTVVDIPDYVFEPEDITRRTVTEEEWALNLGAGNYAATLIVSAEGEFLQYSYKCTNNAILFEGNLMVFEGDKVYLLQNADGTWYAVEIDKDDVVPAVVPARINMSDYEYSEINERYVPKDKTGAEVYYSFGFRDGALSYVIIQTTLDSNNPEYYEFVSYNIEGIGTVEIEIPDYTIIE